LEPQRAERLGRDLTDAHPAAGILLSLPQIVVDPDRQKVSVRVTGASRLVLLRLVSGSDLLEVSATAVSQPMVVG